MSPAHSGFQTTGPWCTAPAHSAVEEGPPREACHCRWSYDFSWSDLASGAAWHVRFRLKGKQEALSGRVAIIGLPLSTRMTVKADRESGRFAQLHRAGNKKRL